MLARNDFLDFQVIGTGPREAFWLQNTLAEHPSISIASPQKRSTVHDSLRFADHELDQWRSRFRDAGPLSVLGAIDHQLMLDPNAGARMANAFPHVKLVAFLRNPVELLFDLYHFKAASRPVAGRLLDELERHPEWLNQLRYHRNLLPFLDRFHPDQICLVIYERFFSDEVANYQRLCTYLGVDGEFRPSPVIATPSKLGHSPATVLSDTVQRMTASLTGRKGETPQVSVDEETRWRLLDLLDGELIRLEQTLDINLDIWRGQQQQTPERSIPADNVIPLPGGAERRQRLAQRRALHEAGS